MYLVATHSLQKAIHCVMRISPDQISCFRELCGAAPASSGTNLTMLLLSYCHPTVAWSETKQLHSLLSGNFTRLRVNVLLPSQTQKYIPGHISHSVYCGFRHVLVSVAGKTLDLTVFLRSFPGQICTEQPCSAAKHMHAAFSF